MATLNKISGLPSFTYTDTPGPHSFVKPGFERNTSPIVEGRNYVSVLDTALLGIDRINIQRRLRLKLSQPVNVAKQGVVSAFAMRIKNGERVLLRQRLASALRRVLEDGQLLPPLPHPLRVEIKTA